MNHTVYSVQDLHAVFGEKSSIENPDACVRTLLTDSRKVTDKTHALFFALKARRDGHSFIDELYHAGLRHFVIDDPYLDCSKYPHSNFFFVDNTLEALQKLATFHRHRFSYPVMAITGSAGKTIVKEWLYQLLMPEYRVVRNPKSFNSQLGVPISVWEMSDSDNFAIFEAGISEAGEMEKLKKIICPTIGIFTNIGSAHDEGFASKHAKIAEKLKLFEAVDLLIYPKRYLKEYQGEIPGKTKFSWDYGKADLEIFEDHKLPNQSRLLKAKFKGQILETILPFRDDPSTENAIICWATLLAMGYQAAEVTKRLEKLIFTNTRLELKNAIHDCSLIDDSFDLDIPALAIALDFLQQQQGRKMFILSDLPVQDANQDTAYQRLADLIEHKSVDCLIAIGKQITHYSNLFAVETHFFESTDEFLLNFSLSKLSNTTILLKGTRDFGFQRISKLLIQQVHETVLEINLDALIHNLNYYKSLLKPAVKLMMVVKDFSYGSGSFEIANVLAFHHVDYLAVAYADEGIILREAGVTLPIMVFTSGTQSIEAMIKNNLEPEIYSHRILDAFIQLLLSKGIENYPIHIKLDTGLHRLGFMEFELDQLLIQLKKTNAIRVQSIFSHCAANEDPRHDAFTQYQIDLFDRLSKKMIDHLGYAPIRHINNTSGIDRWPDAQFDMVRLGISLYGINQYYPAPSPFRTVLSLKTTISQIKEIPAGDTVGYGRKGIMPQGGKVAIVKIGYGDGYNQAFRNGVGGMMINNQYAPTIGEICMDMTILDITGLEVSEDDEVVIFDDQLKIEAIGKKININPKELLTGIPHRVKRVYYYE